MSERAKSSRSYNDDVPPLHKGRQRLPKQPTQQVQTQSAPQTRSLQPAPSAPTRPPQPPARTPLRPERYGDASFGPGTIQRISDRASLPAAQAAQRPSAGVPARRQPSQTRQPDMPRYDDRRPLNAQQVQTRPSARTLTMPAADTPRAAGTFSSQYVVMLSVALVSILVIFLFIKPGAMPHLSNVVAARAPAANSLSAAAIPVEGGLLPMMPTPAGQHTLLGRSTLTPQQIDAVLAEYGSPAQGTGRVWVEIGNRFNLNAAYALAFFVHESGAGTAQNWAGLKPDGSTTHNVGNIICAGYPTCYGRFRDYESWERGIEDWYELIAYEYVQGREIHTLEDIIPIYAPSFENDVPQYVNVVATLIKKWGEL